MTKLHEEDNNSSEMDDVRYKIRRLRDMQLEQYDEDSDYQPWVDSISSKTRLTSPRDLDHTSDTYLVRGHKSFDSGGMLPKRSVSNYENHRPKHNTNPRKTYSADDLKKQTLNMRPDESKSR